MSFILTAHSKSPVEDHRVKYVNQSKDSLAHRAHRVPTNTTKIVAHDAVAANNLFASQSLSSYCKHQIE
ncbi:hypothetical protein BHYA_0010g00220 [Botrytis hyacinthi]|uniref:Uncharacterized protein n=1 Tax=Botrytis hyacinthi TaxID=278943 RepID=A0A4Z1H3Y1_9HELO|nr:hypothetical protein BHYA_0010g00220 [Botrytis hyacinthi]